MRYARLELNTVGSFEQRDESDSSGFLRNIINSFPPFKPFFSPQKLRAQISRAPRPLAGRPFACIPENLLLPLSLRNIVHGRRITSTVSFLFARRRAYEITPRR